MTVVINKSEHNEEDGLDWKVKTPPDKEVKKKWDNITAEILLNGEGKKNKHSMLGIVDGHTSPEKMVNILQQKLVCWYNNLAQTVLS